MTYEPDARSDTHRPSVGRPQVDSPQADGPNASGPNTSRDVPRTLAGRIERLSKAPPPPPKGKMVVMVLLACAVLYAIIDGFSRERPSKEGAEQGTERGEIPAVAPIASPRPASDPQLPAPAGALPGLPADAEPLPPLAGDPLPDALPVPLREHFRTLRQSVEVPPAIRIALRGIAARVDATPEAMRPEARRLVLEELLRFARVGRYRSAALDAAAWLAGSAEPESRRALARLLGIASGEGLASDASAPSALLFLGRYPGDVGTTSRAELDALLLDPARPLALRVGAARIRDDTERDAGLTALMENAETHPALRDALRHPHRPREE